MQLILCLKLVGRMLYDSVPAGTPTAHPRADFFYFFSLWLSLMHINAQRTSKTTIGVLVDVLPCRVSLPRRKHGHKSVSDPYLLGYIELAVGHEVVNIFGWNFHCVIRWVRRVDRHLNLQNRTTLKNGLTSPGRANCIAVGLSLLCSSHSKLRCFTIHP